MINVSVEEYKLKMKHAYMCALKSDDRSTKNGAILCLEGWNVVSGWNHFVPGYGDLEAHHERPLKYALTEHAERDVIYKAAAHGIKTKGLTMVCPWATCPDCARAIVEAEIAELICHQACCNFLQERPDWKPLVELGLEIVRKGGVKVIMFDGKVGGVENLHNGVVWYP